MTTTFPFSYEIFEESLQNGSHKYYAIVTEYKGRYFFGLFPNEQKYYLLKYDKAFMLWRCQSWHSAYRFNTKEECETEVKIQIAKTKIEDEKINGSVVISTRRVHP